MKQEGLWEISGNYLHRFQTEVADFGFISDKHLLGILFQSDKKYTGKLRISLFSLIDQVFSDLGLRLLCTFEQPKSGNPRFVGG